MLKGLFTHIKPWMCLLLPGAAPGLGSQLSAKPVFRHPGVFPSFEVSRKLQVRNSGAGGV